MNRKAKKKKIFGKLFLLYVAALLCASGVVLYHLYGRLREYQKGVDAAEYSERVSRAAEVAFEEYVSALTAETLTQFWFQSHPDSFDEYDRVEKYWGQRLQAAKAYKEAEYSPQAPVFVLADEEGVFAKFAVSGEELDRKVQDPVFTEQQFSSCFVETLDRNEVYCAGKRVPQEHIIQKEICFEEADYAEQLTNPVCKVTYEVALLVPEPAFEVENVTPYDMRTLPDDGQMYYTLKRGEELPFRRHAGKLVQALLDFYLCGSENTGENMSAALEFVEKGSAAYDIIKGSYNSVIWRRNIKEPETELSFAPVIVWADNCVSVDVTYRVVKANAQDKAIAEGRYRIFFYDFGDGFKVYDFALI